MRDPRQASLTGKAGEYMVASQLLIRGVVPHWPAADMGCDLMADTGCRIQVRCAHLYNRKSNGPVYFFPLPKTRRVANSDTTARLIPRRSFIEVCDVVTFWGIEQNRFWVIPASLCDQTTGVELGAELKSKPRFVGSIADMREMKKLGYSYYKIAKHYGLSCQNSVKQLIESGKDSVDETITFQMRAYEGRWDLITEFVRPVVVSPIQAEEAI